MDCIGGGGFRLIDLAAAAAAAAAAEGFAGDVGALRSSNPPNGSGPGPVDSGREVIIGGDRLLVLPPLRDVAVVLLGPADPLE